MKIRSLLQLAPVAVVATLSSGLAMGAFWGMGPVFAIRIGLDHQSVAVFMSIAIIGGALLQYPLGRYSDHHDRRHVLLLASAAAACMALLMLLLSFAGQWILLAALLYGGMAFAIYPLAVAHLMDQLDNSDILAGGSALLLLHGLGSAIGPALAGQLMGWAGPAALPVYFALMQLMLAVYALHRVHIRKPSAPDNPAPFVAMLRTSPTVLELLPEDDHTSHATPQENDVRP